MMNFNTNEHAVVSNFADKKVPAQLNAGTAVAGPLAYYRLVPN
jgi:hypothetical protein